MRDTTLLLPFALPPVEHAKDLLAALNAPALALLLSRGREQPVLTQAAFAASLPHESLLAGTDGSNSPPLAHALMATLGLSPSDGHWFVLQPAHFHVALDHLVLTDLRELAIDDAASRALFESVEPLFTESGHELRYGDARHWFLRADNWSDLRTTTPDAATGHNVDIWLPSGEFARPWRKLHNEVQMLWHQHPLNEQRESCGQRRINALWLWGGASSGGASAAPSPATPPIPADSGPLVNDSLVGPALAGDWGSWLAALQAIDLQQVAPLVAALRNGEIDRLTLQLSDATRLREWRIGRAGMRKFWVRPDITRALS